MSHIHEFVEAWHTLEFEGEVRWFAKLRAEMSLGGRAHSPADLAERLSANRRGFQCYVQLNPARGARGTRPKAVDVTHYRGFLLDIDPDPGFEGSALATLHIALDQLARLLDLSMTPWIIDSGRGMQAWILGPLVSLAPGEHTALRASVSRLIRQLSLPKGFHADPMVCDVSRVARLPGTVNTKTGRTAFVRTRGRLIPGLKERLLELAPEESDVEDIPLTPSADTYRAVFAHLTSTAQDFISFGVSYPGRHSALWHTADLLHRLGLSRAAAERALVLGARRCRPKLPRADVTYALARTYKG